MVPRCKLEKTQSLEHVGQRPESAGAHIDAYKHEPLPDNDHIRILTIHPAEVLSDPIVCNIKTVSLKDKPIYTAMSYSWAMQDGDDSRSRVITIENLPYPITRNLYEGLRRFREHNNSKPLDLWVDAVCVDQDNDAERTAQVAMMAQIFASAGHTYVWLGEDECEGESSEALDLFEKVRRALEIRNGWRTAGHCLVNPGNGSECSYPEEGQICTCGLPMGSSVKSFLNLWQYDYDVHEDYHAVNHSLLQIAAPRIMAPALFFAKRYWKRRWVFQELRHSTMITIYWGSVFAQVSHILESLIETSFVLSFLVSSSPPATKRFNIEWPRQDLMNWEQFDDMFIIGKNEKQSLDLLLTQTMKMDCSDPRDRLYALLSLSSNTWMMPDYTRSAAEVYTSFARHVVETTSFFNLLKNLHRKFPIKDAFSAALPSWVPDLRLIWWNRQDGFMYDRIHKNTVSFLNDSIIELDLYCTGRIERLTTDLPWSDGQFEAILHGFVPPWSSELSQEELAYRLRNVFAIARSKEFDYEAGDLLCTTSTDWQHLDDDVEYGVILRPADCALNTYKIVHILSRRELKKQWSSGPPWPFERITVKLA